MENELIETILNGVLKDIETLKTEVAELKKSKKHDFSNVNPNKPATALQINAVQKIGGQIWQGMTHQDITNQFNEINKKRNFQIKEPKEVDTDDAGLDSEGLM